MPRKKQEPAVEPTSAADDSFVASEPKRDSGKHIPEAFEGDDAQEAEELKVAETEEPQGEYDWPDPDDAQAETEASDDAVVDVEPDSVVADEEKPVENVPVATDPYERFDSEILGYAGQLGMTGAEIQRYATADDLQAEVERRIGVVNQQGTQPRMDEFKLDFDPETADPEMVKAFEDMNGHYNARMANYERMLTSMHQTTQARESQAMVNAFEDQINALGDEWTAILGKGTHTDFAAGSVERRARIELGQEIQDRLDIAKARGRSATVKSVFDKAKNAVFADRMQATVRNGVASMVKKRSSQTLSRPTQRNSKPLQGEEAAIQFANEFLAEHEV